LTVQKFLGVEGGRAATVSPARTRFLKKLRDKVEYILIKIYSNCRQFNLEHFGVFLMKIGPRVWALDHKMSPDVPKKFNVYLEKCLQMMENPDNEDILGTLV